MARGYHATYLAFCVPRSGLSQARKKPPLPTGNGGLACGDGRGSGVGLAAVVGGSALAGAALAGALAHRCSNFGVVSGFLGPRSHCGISSEGEGPGTVVAEQRPYQKAEAAKSAQRDGWSRRGRQSAKANRRKSTQVDARTSKTHTVLTTICL